MRRLWKWLVLGLVVLVGLAFAGWYFFLKTDPEPRAAIKQTPIVTESTVAGDASSTASGLDGTWTVKPGDTQNFVGYRVTEKLFANISETEATGRTDNVTASMKIDGTTVSDVTVTADLRDLKSDNSFRDGRIRSEGLESDQFPEAKFVLTEPITLAAVPAAGETVKTEAKGKFTLHGVTKDVTMSLEGRWDGKQVQVVGSLPIAFDEYGVSAPTAPAVASVDDHGEMELQLFFDKEQV
jgi:polyisoprenoid-binding protein YceI